MIPSEKPLSYLHNLNLSNILELPAQTPCNQTGPAISTRKVRWLGEEYSLVTLDDWEIQMKNEESRVHLAIGASIGMSTH